MLNKIYRKKSKARKILGFVMAELFCILSIASVIIPGNTPVVSADEPLSETYRSDRIIVSLGDSYSSGEGIEPFYGQNQSEKEKVKDQNWLAHRSEKAWSGLLTLKGVSGNMSDHHWKGDEKENSNWYFVASSGAETTHLMNKQEKKYKRGNLKGEKNIDNQLSIFDELGDRRADYVTLTLGGNDVDFGGICTHVVLGSTYLNKSLLSEQLTKARKKMSSNGSVRKALKNSYLDIAEKAGNQATILVAGYPHLFDKNGKGFVVSKQEATLVNEAIDYFNDQIAGIVEECKKEGSIKRIEFISVSEAFDGHEAYSSNPYINGFILEKQKEDLEDRFSIGSAVSAYSVHPNEEGAKAYARCVQRKINELDYFIASGEKYGDSIKFIASHNLSTGHLNAMEVPVVDDLQHPDLRFLYPGVDYFDYHFHPYYFGSTMPSYINNTVYQDNKDYYYYDENGMISRIENAQFDDRGEIGMVYDIEYDWQGRKITETETNTYDFQKKSKVYQYNENRQLSKVTSDDYDAEYTYTHFGEYRNGISDDRITAYSFKVKCENKTYSGQIRYSDGFNAENPDGEITITGQRLLYSGEEVHLFYKNGFCDRVVITTESNKHTINISYFYRKVDSYAPEPFRYTTTNISEKTIKEALGIPDQATVFISYGDKVFTKEAMERMEFVSVEVSGTGEYSGYIAHGDFEVDLGSAVNMYGWSKEGEEQVETGWKTQMEDTLKQFNKQQEDGGLPPNGILGFLYDFNQDGIPEMLLSVPVDMVTDERMHLYYSAGTIKEGKENPEQYVEREYCGVNTYISESVLGQGAEADVKIELYSMTDEGLKCNRYYLIQDRYAQNGTPSPKVLYGCDGKTEESNFDKLNSDVGQYGLYLQEELIGTGYRYDLLNRENKMFAPERKRYDKLLEDIRSY